jgi:hypothetical protein
MDSYFVTTCLETIAGNWHRLNTSLLITDPQHSAGLETIEDRTAQSRMISDGSNGEQRLLDLKAALVKPIQV